jgi:hypothetical protein
MADKNTENEKGDNLGYGSQRKNIMDEGLTLMRTTRKGADKNTNDMNEHENCPSDQLYDTYDIT